MTQKDFSEAKTTEVNETTAQVTEETVNSKVQTGNDQELNIEERVSTLEKELEVVTKAKEEQNQQLLRMMADFDNFRRRTRQEHEQLLLNAGEDLIKKILPVVDSLERALASENAESSAWCDGIKLTLKQFQSILTTEGLEAVDSIEQEFDPQVHEAVMQEESENVTISTVVMELQKGYKYKGKLIRPALVKVAVPKL